MRGSDGDPFRGTLPTMEHLPRLDRGRRMPYADRTAAGAELLKGYQAGKSVRQLCAETGYSIGRTRRLLIEAGVEFRSRGGATRQTADS
jgi:Helix-turn-helix domain